MGFINIGRFKKNETGKIRALSELYLAKLLCNICPLSHQKNRTLRTQPSQLCPGAQRYLWYLKCSVKFLNFGTLENVAEMNLKFKQRPNDRAICPKEANGMVKCED